MAGGRGVPVERRSSSAWIAGVKEVGRWGGRRGCGVVSGEGGRLEVMRVRAAASDGGEGARSMSRCVVSEYSNDSKDYRLCEHTGEMVL